MLADEMADRDGGVDHEHAADRADEHQEDELEEEGDLADADIVRQEIGQLAEELGDLPKQIQAERMMKTDRTVTKVQMASHMIETISLLAISCQVRTAG